MKKVAILGGGMAGLAAAWSLSEPECRPNLEVTVYQRGWRLGGKGASSRGHNGRIEEHGLHVWLGYYDNAFRLMRAVYDELDRPRNDPACEISGFDQAFSPVDRVGIGENSENGWSHWLASFSTNSEEPGRPPSSASPGAPVASFLGRAIVLLMDFAESLPGPSVSGGPRVLFSNSPEPPINGGAGRLLRQAEMAVMIAALQAIRLLGSTDAGPSSPAGLLLGRLAELRREVAARVPDGVDARRAADLMDLVTTCVKGVLADRLLTNPAGFAVIDHLDLREWLRRHGAMEQTCQSALIKGLYDLVFAYQDGDFDKPRFAAGLGLFLAGRMFFEYRGSIFWRMQAGMGDVVFAPLYQALRARGVKFEFFHRVDQLLLSADGRRVAAVRFGRQALLREGLVDYEPLCRVRNLPCFPAAPIEQQLAGPAGPDLERHWSDRTVESPRTLTLGVEFDDIVLAVSIGMLPHTCPELIARSPRWQAMVDGVSTVPTQAVQLWFRRTEEELGWPYRGSTVSGYAGPFDTYAAMSHLLPREDWPDPDAPRSLAYFCSALTDAVGQDPQAADRLVRANAEELLAQRIGHFWPAAVDARGQLRWDELVGDSADQGESRLTAQYWRANVDPSDRYVQCLPGSLRHRLRADESGFDNLFLAGDWVDNGLNAGCIEGAALGGLQAANALRGRPLMTAVLGTRYDR